MQKIKNSSAANIDRLKYELAATHVKTRAFVITMCALNTGFYLYHFILGWDGSTVDDGISIDGVDMGVDVLNTL